MNERFVDRTCQSLDCDKPSRPDSAFCSDECRAATKKEAETAPYGDEFHFYTEQVS